MRFSLERVLSLTLNAALLVALSAGCSEEPINPAHNEFNSRELVFTASYDPADAATRTQMDAEQKHILWSEGDKISIFDSDEIGYEFTASGAGSSASFTLTDDDSPSDTDLWYALYPYDEDSDLSDGVFTTTLRDEYTVNRAGSFNDGMNISVAKSSTMSLSFKNVLAWLKVASAGLGDDVVKIEMRGNKDEVLAGQIGIDYTGTTPVATLAEGNGSKVMTINVENYVSSVNLPKADRVFFYIPVLPQTFEKGFTLTFYSESGETGGFVYENEVTFIRNNRNGMFAAITPLDDLKIVFADPNFEAYCLENFDTNHDGILTRAEAAEITQIEVCTDEIESIQEIEFMPNLYSLRCYGSSFSWLDDGAYVSSGMLTSLDLSNNTALTYLNCEHNQLTNLDVSNNTALTHLVCKGNQLTGLDLSQNIVLNALACSINQLTSLDLSNNTELADLLCDYNQLTNLDVPDGTTLTRLDCRYNQLTSLDVSQNPALVTLWCSGNQLPRLDVSNNSALTELNCWNNQLTTLDVSNNPALTELRCHCNQIESLDISYNKNLAYLGCSENQISAIDFSNNLNLVDINCNYNLLTSIDVSKNLSLTNLSCAGNKITTLDISQNSSLNYLDCSPMEVNGSNVLATLFISKGQEIPNVTIDRSAEYIPSGTTIVEKQDNGSTEGTSDEEVEP